MRFTVLVFALLLFPGCDDADNSPPEPTPAPPYFPAATGEWETMDMDALGWDATQLPRLYGFLESNNTRAFLIIKDGRIVLERYWGIRRLTGEPFDSTSLWYWASAGKALTATLAGIAQAEGHLDINDPTSDYLGAGWTSMTPEREMAITLRHQLTMTTGLDYTSGNLDCTEPDCLRYRAEPGEQWYYHNAPYTLLADVVEAATGADYNTYTDQKIESRIGMSGFWRPSGNNNVYWSTARDMARFGWLILNEGQWGGTSVVDVRDYIRDMIAPSQALNPSYGYLWWLNGQPSVILPGLPTAFNMELAGSAPADMVAAMGKNGQFLCLVPSQNLIVVRMGEAPGDELVPALFHDQLWARLAAVILS